MRLLLALALLPGCGKVFVSDTDVLPLYDQDHDGFYAPEATAVGVDGPYDCDDEEPAVHPGADDPCDGVDNDCDGTADNGSESLTFAYDADHDGYGDDGNVRHACTAPDGFVALGGDCDDGDGDVHPEAIEVCDGVDDDCDGATDADDDDLADGTLSWADADHDGYGDPDAPVTACGVPDGYVDDDQDCDDGDPDVRPGAVETCDGVDDDCDGAVDDDDTGVTGTSVWYLDADADSSGGDVTVNACEAPAGYVATTGDCHDDDGTAHPGAAEHCGTYDYDCDGKTDEADSVDVTDIYQDADGDGYGAAGSTTTGCTTTGWVRDSQDCGDSDSNVHPGATEVCADGVDDDCDGNVDPCSYVAGRTMSSATGDTIRTSTPTSVTSATGWLAIADAGSGGVGITRYPMYVKGGGLSFSFDTLITATSPSLVVEGDFVGSEDLLVVDSGTVYLIDDPTAISDVSQATASITGAGSVFTDWAGSGLVSAKPTSAEVDVLATAGLTGAWSASDLVTSKVTGSYGSSSVASADVDGDGTEDLVAGSPDADLTAGAVYVFLGPLAASTTTSSADTTYQGNLTAGAGAFLATEDGDGDGYVDLYVAAPMDDDAAKNAGAIYTFLGPAPGGKVAASAAYATFGGVFNEQLGSYGLAVLDIDSDGTSDVLAGGGSGVVAAPGGVSGATVVTSGCFDFGSSSVTTIAAIHDADLDGQDDFAIVWWAGSDTWLYLRDEL